MLGKLKRVVIIMLRHVCGCLLKFLPTDFVCFFFFRKEQGSLAYLIEVGGSSYMGMCSYWAAFQEMIDLVKLQAFSVLCAHICISGQEVMNAVKQWSQSKTCFLKYFILDICQNVGFVCFRMCWRILMTLLLQLAVVEGHQELPLVTIWQDQNSSKL